VCVEKRGRERVYRLDTKRLHEVTSGWLKAFLGETIGSDDG
jgi:hypothetical protein